LVTHLNRPAMKQYSKAPSEIHDRVKHLIKCFHSELHDAGLRVDILSVSDDDPDGTPLTLNGYSCYATVKVLDSKQRAKGAGDVEIVIDEAAYLTMPDPRKDALLDHELYHVELRKNKKGRVKLDEHGRPKCGMRKHDYQFGWFTEIATRHGAAAIEVKQATQMFLAEKQTLFAFISEPAAIDSPQPTAAVRRFVDTVRGKGMSVTISAGDKVVTFGDVHEEHLKPARQLAADAGYLTKAGLARALKIDEPHAHKIINALIMEKVIGPVDDDLGRYKHIVPEPEPAGSR
jgi:hypothetical protein